MYMRMYMHLILFFIFLCWCVFLQVHVILSEEVLPYQKHRDVFQVKQMMDNKEIESLMKIMAFDASKSYVTWKEVNLRMLVFSRPIEIPILGDLHKKNCSFKHIFRADRSLEHDIEASNMQARTTTSAKS